MSNRKPKSPMDLSKGTGFGIVMTFRFGIRSGEVLGPCEFASSKERAAGKKLGSRGRRRSIRVVMQQQYR